MALWDRRDDETTKAYAAFSAYRDLGKVRSVDRAYQQQQGNSKRAARHWWDWYEAFDWRPRAEAYDAQQERQARKDAEAAHRRQIREFQQRQQQRAEKLHRASVLLLDKALTRLADLDVDEMEPSQLVSVLRAAATATETAGNAEAAALGVEELLKALPDEPGDDL
jgi:hypothetical protein